MSLLLATTPWLLLVVVLPLLVRERPALASYPSRPRADRPLVSIVVPVRDDSHRVGSCLAALLDTDYPAYEIIVVDAGSQDGTREIVAALESRARDRVRLVEAGPDPEMGPGQRATKRSAYARAWSRGAEDARGDLILFTEPDALHDSKLLGRAVNALVREGADVVTVLPRLVMAGFWERLVMPHVWLILTAGLPSARTANRRQSPERAVASREFVLVRRDAYARAAAQARSFVGPDAALALCRAVMAAGGRLFVAHGGAELEARVGRSLVGIESELRATVPSASRPALPAWTALALSWLLAALPTLLFALPPALLVGWVVGLVRGPAVGWALRASALSLVFWLALYARHRIRPAYAVAFPLGAVLCSAVFVRGLLGGAAVPAARPAPRA